MNKNLLLTLMMLSSITLSVAQDNSNTLVRRLNDKLLDLIVSYEQFSAFNEEYMQFAFCDLFENTDATVWCDYFTSPDYGKQIPVSKYAAYSVENISVRSVEISDVQKTGLVKGIDGQWEANVILTKELEFADEIGTCFSSSDPLHFSPFKVSLNCVYETENEQFLIRSIESVPINGKSNVEEKFLVYDNDNGLDNILYYNGKKIQPDMFGQVIIKPGGVFSTNDDDLIVLQSTINDMGSYEHINLELKHLKMRIVPHFSFSPFGAYMVSSNNSNVISSSSGKFELGFDMGVTFKFESALHGGFYTGVAFSSSWLKLESDDINYSFVTTDKNLVSYTRSYSVKKAFEQFNFKDIVIPFYFSLFRNIGVACVSLDAGVKLFLNCDTESTPYNVVGQVTSLFEDHVIDSSNLNREYSSFLWAASYARNTYDVCAFTRMGVDMNIYDNRLFGLLKLGYEQGFNESYSSNDSYWFDESRHMYPFVYSAELGSDISVRSFADCISYGRKSVFFDFGLKYKF